MMLILVHLDEARTVLFVEAAGNEGVVGGLRGHYDESWDRNFGI